MEANEHIGQIHHRMPVLLDDHSCEMWLDPSKSFAECCEAITESEVIRTGQGVDIVEVGPLVGNIRN